MNSDLYRSLSTEDDWPFFDRDCTIPESDRYLIWPLTQASARQFWEAHVSSEPLEHHPMLLPKGHWLAPTVQGPSWLTESSPGMLVSSEATDVESSLSTSFSLDSDERVYFVLMREDIYSVPMHLFARHWYDFLLLGDEGPFLFHPETGAFACFGPNGQLSFGGKCDDSPPAP